MLMPGYLTDFIGAIKEFCYELYKLDWIHDHISYEQYMYIYKDYFEGLYDTPKDYTFNDYLEEFGFDGEIYATYEEFLENEYLDKDYIKELLDNQEYYDIYLNTV